MFFEKHVEELVEHFVPEKSDPKEVNVITCFLTQLQDTYILDI